MFTLSSFYKSDEWYDLVTQLKLERVNEDGDVICEHCGKPIIKAYHCIGHHKVELTEQNVNDFSISLNPDSIMLVHHKCHNQIHERFGYEKPKEVWIVYGPPCAGKSTWVRDTAGPEDIVLDIDNIWQMITVNDGHVKPNRLKTNVFGVRDCILDMIRTRTGKWRRAYVIGGYPLSMDRTRLEQSLGARCIFIYEDKETCLERARVSERHDWEKHIESWFDDYCE